jgi:hypothetical protein
MATAYDFYTIFKFYSALKSDKENWIQKEVMIFVPIVIIVSPLIINAVLFVVFRDPKLLWLRDSLIGDEHDWISFMGSIIGGSITMVALYYTLKREGDVREKEKKDHINELVYQSVPILETKLIDIIDESYMYEFINLKTDLDYSERNYPTGFALSIKNTSTFLARHLSFNSISLTRVQFDPKTNKAEDVLFTAFTEQANKDLNNSLLLPPGFTEVIHFNFEYPYKDCDPLTLTSIMSYFDNTGKLKIESSFTASLRVKYTLNNVIGDDDTKVIWSEFKEITDPVSKIIRVGVVD